MVFVVIIFRMNDYNRITNLVVEVENGKGRVIICCFVYIGFLFFFLKSYYRESVVCINGFFRIFFWVALNIVFCFFRVNI